MAGRGLFSRSSNGGGQPLRKQDQIDSILEHLRVLLNTRQGDSVTAPSFGVIDFVDLVHNFPSAIETLQRSIRATILEYEPRLRNVSVQYVPDGEPLLVRFEISGQLATDSLKSVRFRTRVSPGGKMEVS